MPRSRKRVGKQPASQAGSTRASDALFVQSIEKGLRVLYAFGSEHRALGLTDIATATGFDMSTAQRFVHTWQRLGYLKRDPHARRYTLAAKLLDFSFMYLRSSGLVEIAMPHLVALGNTCEENINLMELDAADVLYIFRLPRKEIRYSAGVVGARVPAFCTSAGRAILAHLPQEDARGIIQSCDLTPQTPHTQTDRREIFERLAEVKQRGYSIVDQEVLVGEISVAAPILDYAGTPIAAVSIPVSKTRWSVKSVQKTLAPHVLETARAISRACGGLAAYHGS